MDKFALKLLKRSVTKFNFRFQHQSNYSKAMEQNISTLIEMVDSVSLRYKLASVLGLKKIIATLINDQCSYYLKDTNYGRTDS